MPYVESDEESKSSGKSQIGKEYVPDEEDTPSTDDDFQRYI